MFDADDHRYMAHATRLALRGLYTTDPNPLVGCVLVRNNKVVGEGWHAYAGGDHAEVMALQQAGERAYGASAYVTLEPCCHHGKTPPCSAALIAAGVRRVVAAMEDPNPLVAGNGLQQLAAAGIEVANGLLATEAERLNPGFIMRMRQRRPYVRCKLAMSLDGRTAMASGESRWITGTAAREDVHRLRARSSAIMTGIGTVLADDPSLNARPDLPHENVKQPLRIVLDPHLRIPPGARLLSLPGEAMVVTANEDEAAHERIAATGAEIVVAGRGPDAVDISSLITLLGTRGINDLLVEAGATLSGSVLRTGIIDELIIYMAPKLMGNSARGLFNIPELESMADAVNLVIDDIRPCGNDWRITAHIRS